MKVDAECYDCGHVFEVNIQPLFDTRASAGECPGCKSRLTHVMDDDDE